ncbi:MAG: GGDEF domain-containing protein, partial [Gammaproteobacteria bacterium]
MATAEPPDIRLPNQASEGDLPEGADPFAPEPGDSVEVAVSQPIPVADEDAGLLTDALLAGMLVLLILLALTSIRLLKLREIIRRNRDEVVSVRDEARQLRRMLADAEEKAEARIRKRTGKLLETTQNSRRELDQLSLANKQLRGTMRSDPLTGLANGRYFHHRLETELRRALRSRQLVALILCDLDGFTNYNEKHGHDKGDVWLN